ncbi:dimethylsulfoniopropionate demethylase [Kiloniella sp.]|uniref:dimethylsulfoniopropionate demethylase n=1 Tax=Kiloniella sp. TaxID=1938587 RepID=UPI003B029547
MVVTPTLSRSRRLRQTPYSDRVEACGAKAYTVYNHMLLATVFRSLEEDYQHLCENVQIWDVSCERQVEITGPDAAALTQLMTCRDLSKAKYGQCFYAPLVDENGGMVNDPIILKLAEDRYWLSIADSDVLLWAKGLASGRGMDVKVFEPDVFPLAVQGPMAEEVMAKVFGEKVRDIKFFRFAELFYQNHRMVVARSGWSRQGGFEIYLDNSALALDLWDRIWDVGKDYNIFAGCPNGIERVEGGLLSYGNDMSSENTPYECGLGKYVNLEADIEFVGRKALEIARDQGLGRKICNIRFDKRLETSVSKSWDVLNVGGDHIGNISSGCNSKKMGGFIAIAMLDQEFWDEGTIVLVQTPLGDLTGTVANFPFD